MSFQHYFGFCPIDPSLINDAQEFIDACDEEQAMSDEFLDQENMLMLGSRNAWLTHTIASEAKRLKLPLLQALETRNHLFSPQDIQALQAEIEEICRADGWDHADSWEDSDFEQAYEEVANIEGVLATWQTREIESPDEGDSPFDLFICLFALKELVAIAQENQQGLLYHSYN